MITRLASRSSIKASLALALTCHAVGKVAQEELYRVVVLTYFSSTIQYNQIVQHHAGAPLAHKVSALALPRYHEVFVDYYNAILKRCSKVTSLLIAGPLLGIVALPTALDELIIRGAMGLHSYHDKLVNLQRLCLFPMYPDKHDLPHLAQLPHLTHLAFSLAKNERPSYQHWSSSEREDDFQIIAKGLKPLVTSDKFKLLVILYRDYNAVGYDLKKLQQRLDPWRDGVGHRVRLVDRPPNMEDWTEDGRWNWHMDSKGLWDAAVPDNERF